MHWTASSQYDNYSIFSLIHNIAGEVDIYDHLMSTGVFTLKKNKICMWAPEIISDYTLDLDLLTIWN